MSHRASRERRAAVGWERAYARGGREPHEPGASGAEGDRKGHRFRRCSATWLHASLHLGEGAGLPGASAAVADDFAVLGRAPAENAGGGRRPDEASEAADERREDPLLPGAGGIDDVPRVPDWTQLPTGHGCRLHRHAPESGASAALPSSERADDAALRAPAAGGCSDAPEPVADRLGELLHPGAGQPGLRGD